MAADALDRPLLARGVWIRAAELSAELLNLFILPFRIRATLELVFALAWPSPPRPAAHGLWLGPQHMVAAVERIHRWIHRAGGNVGDHCPGGAVDRKVESRSIELT